MSTLPHLLKKKRCSAALYSGSNTPTLGISVMEYVSVMEFVTSGRSLCAVKVLMPELFRPYGWGEPNIKRILHQHSCAVEMTQRVSFNLSVPNTTYEKMMHCIGYTIHSCHLDWSNRPLADPSALGCIVWQPVCLRRTIWPHEVKTVLLNHRAKMACASAPKAMLTWEPYLWYIILKPKCSDHTVRCQ